MPIPNTAYKYLDEDRLDRWLHKHGYPQIPVRWAITPDTGKIPNDAWSIYDGNNDALPLEKTLTFQRANGGKSIIHINLQRIRSDGTAIIPPEIVRERNELDERRKNLDLRHAELTRWEGDLRGLDIDLRKTFALQTQTGSGLESRLKVAQENLKTWQDSIAEQSDRDAMHVQELSTMADEKNALAEKNVIAAQIGHVFDKIAAVIQLRQVKKWEDAKPSDIADYQQFLVDRADRRFFSNHPDPVVLLGDSFTRMPKEHMEMFARDIIKWVVYNHPGMFNEVSQEIKEEQQQVSRENE